MLCVASPQKTVTEDVLPKNDFSYNKRIESEYNQMLNIVADEVNKILNKFDQNDPSTSLHVLEMLRVYANSLHDWASKLVTGLVYNLNIDDERQWKKHSALMSEKTRKKMETAPIKPMMVQYLKENVGIIQSMPIRAAERVQQIVLENLKTGEYRAEGLVDQIMNVGKVTKSRAQLIARTEVSRISTGFTKARSEELEIGFYVWRTSHDARVRGPHRLMDKTLVSWGEPAAPEELDGKKSYGHYHPGEIFNCRCYPQPLIRIDDVAWPAKVYRNGRIQMMNRNDFITLSTGKVPMAA
jgi:SPP1 gp7 family putative phage head morphogenesis protein